MSAIASTGSIITGAHKQQFIDEGYFVVERCVPEEHLRLMRDNLNLPPLRTSP